MGLVKSRKCYTQQRVERLEEELMRAVYFKNGGVVTRYPIGLGGLWRHGWRKAARFSPKPNDTEIARMLRLRKHAMTSGAVKVWQKVEEMLLQVGVVINDGEKGTTWTRADEEDTSS